MERFYGKPVLKEYETNLAREIAEDNGKNV